MEYPNKCRKCGNLTINNDTEFYMAFDEIDWGYAECLKCGFRWCYTCDELIASLEEKIIQLTKENVLLKNYLAEYKTSTREAEKHFAGIDSSFVYSMTWGDYLDYPPGEGDLDYRDGDDVYEI